MKTKCMSCGGSTKMKKMQKGGITQDIVGMPGYNARTDTMKKGGAVKPKMKAGGSLKPVSADKVGLAKLPTAVRNKMGYMKKGGVKKK